MSKSALIKLIVTFVNAVFIAATIVILFSPNIRWLAFLMVPATVLVVWFSISMWRVGSLDIDVEDDNSF